MKLYKSYSFRSKDPVIDELRTLVQDTYGNKIDYGTFTKIEQDGGPTPACLAGWFFGKTKRPQSASIEAAGRALGYQRTWTKMKADAKPAPSQARVSRPKLKVVS